MYISHTIMSHHAAMFELFIRKIHGDCVEKYIFRSHGNFLVLKNCDNI